MFPIEFVSVVALLFSSVALWQSQSDRWYAVLREVEKEQADLCQLLNNCTRANKELLDGLHSALEARAVNRAGFAGG